MGHKGLKSQVRSSSLRRCQRFLNWSTTLHHPIETPCPRGGTWVVPTWNGVNVNPADVVFWRFLPTTSSAVPPPLDGSSLKPSLWPRDVKIATTKCHCEAYRWPFYSYPFLLLPIFLSGIFILLCCHITIHNNNKNGCFTAKPNGSTIKPTCAYLQTPLLRCHLTPVRPKGSISKNLGYPCLLQWVLTQVLRCLLQAFSPQNALGYQTFVKWLKVLRLQKTKTSNINEFRKLVGRICEEMS